MLALSSTSLFAQPTTLPNIATTPVMHSRDSVLDYSQFITDSQFLLPRNLYILEGTEEMTERLDIYLKNSFMSLSPNTHITATSRFGESTIGRWFFKTFDDEKFKPIEPFELNMVASNTSGTFSGSTTVEVVDKSNTTPVRLLPIGDSLTRAGVYVSQVVNSLPNITSLGTRFYPDDSIPAREGRGGWTLEKYCTFINSPELDSPFVFPVTVPGEHYKGNTRDWKNICYENPNSAAYNGFQKMARGWNDEGEFLYDTNGYYKNPKIGDVMLDPSMPEGQQYMAWNGVSWNPMTIQPTMFEFNFSKYMERFKEAFAEGTPTHISILLGANEFGYNKELDQIDLYIKRLNQVIDSIHAYDPNIKIILCTPTIAPNANLVTSSAKTFYEEYDLRIKYVTSKLLEAFDTDEALERHIYIAPMTLTLDATNGYTFIEKTELIGDLATKVIDADNSIHPNNAYGQIQMGRTLAAVIQRFR